MRRSTRAVIVAVVLVVGGAGLYLYWQTFGDRIRPYTGKQIYARNCAGCHGVGGAGNGPAAQYLFPKPRNFTDGVFKFTTTPNATLPTDTDIERTIREGLSPGGMPGFAGALSEAQIQRVTDYVKTFSKRFQNEKVPSPIEVPEPPDDLITDRRVKRGKEIFRTFGCVSCHGPEGKGDGPTSDAQRDAWGEPVPPRDLTAGNFKRGEAPEDVYTRIMTGINGTGMPPYNDAFQDTSDAWALVAYVKSLARGKRETGSPTPEEAPLRTSGDLRVKRVDPSASLKDPAAAAWNRAPAISMPLYSLWMSGNPVAEAVYLQALHNGDTVAFRLSWRDPTRNDLPAGTTTYSDAAALMFPDLKGALPFLGMGDASMQGGLAHIWHWRAVDQRAVDRGGSVDVADAHPGMQVDYYKLNNDRDPGRTKYPDPDSSRQRPPNQPETFRTSQAAGNPLGNPRPTRPVRSYVAEGFGTLTALEPEKTRVDGRGRYGKTGWSVVMTRPMKTQTDVVQFEPGETKSVALAVWNGEDGDRNGQKDISSWVNLRLEK